MKALLLGCGARREKLMGGGDWDELVRLDINADHKPDIVWDLESPGQLPFDSDSFDEIHAYEVLEHIGAQGDYVAFFRQFSEFWRLLKPCGQIYATTPDWRGIWAWGDPSHRRIINEGTLVFLSQTQYQKQIGKTAMSDFRYLYQADFDAVACERRDQSLWWVMQAVKPSRYQPPA